MTYTVELTEAENKALGVVAYDQLEWIENAVKQRCRIAIDEIVNQEVQRKLSLGEPITGSKDDIVLEADIKSAKEKQAEYEAQSIQTPTLGE
mgnify:CR=1 FL=1